MPIGTLINVATILVGGSIGLLLKRRFPKNIQTIIFQGIGLATLVLGMQMALQVQNLLVLIFSLLLGGILGELLKLETRMEALSEKLKARLGSKDVRFTEGLITAFLIFCIGSMTFVGAINEGLSGDRTLILTKATLDGFTSIALASTYGVGVIFSAIPLLILQGGLSLLATQFQSLFSPHLIAELTATGGALILGIGFNLLEIKAIKTTNLLPALVITIILSLLVG